MKKKKRRSVVLFKPLTEKAVREVALYLENLLPWGGQISILTILKALEARGYGTFYQYQKNSVIVRKVLRKMGWLVQPTNWEVL